MSTSVEPPKPASPAPRPYDVFAAVLSYLVPGLGQIYQGRFGKGLLFMVCLLGMFSLGMYLGKWKNVYLPMPTGRPGVIHDNAPERFRWVSAIFNDRLAYAGQFWIGAAAWPAILQYNERWFVTKESSPFWHDFQRTPTEDELNDFQTKGDKHWDLAWVYTVIAGVLNILVIYDALAGPAFQSAQEPTPSTAPTQEAVPA